MRRIDKVATGSHFWHMRTVGIKALKNGLSKYIRDVASGETLLVTDRDRIVAEIRPPSATDDGATHAQREWAAMIREGIVTPARAPMAGPPPKTVVIPFDELMAEIEADREDR